MKILHICESFEGGVATTVANYADATPEIEHVLLCSTRSGKLDCGTIERFSTIYYFTGNKLDYIKDVRRSVDKEQPDVIHCHSSFGGLFGRVAKAIYRFPAPVVYSPHCFAFEREDIGMLKREMFRIVEVFLFLWTEGLAVCSEREKQLAEGLSRHKKKVVFVPNVASIKPGKRLKKKEGGRLVVAMLGRLAPQKDPEFFAEVARYAKKFGGEFEFVWIGDGEERYREKLKAAGIRITGWVDQKMVAEELQKADFYVHTALWEGFPVAILDAVKVGLPVLARRAPYLVGMPQKYILMEANNIAPKLVSLSKNQSKAKICANAWNDALSENTMENVAKRLHEVYSRVVLKKK
jgi:glycosyltransferase involved in cell wall biosynthesis